MQPANVEPRRKLKTIWMLVIAAAIVFIGANAHLVYVAITSNPGCVAHIKNKGSQAGQFRAAKSAC